MDKPIKKRYGGLKIIWHNDKLKSFINDEITAPIYIRIKPTNICNHRCFYCSYSPEAKNILSETINPKDEIPKDKMMEILGDLRDMKVKAVTYSGGGDPLVYPYITEVLKKTLDSGIDLSMITNGQNLKGENAKILAKAKWVRVSLDSINPETFVKTRRVPEACFHELINNLKEFAKIKDKKCEFGINFVVNHINKDEVYEAAKFFKEIGVNHVKFTPRWIEEGWADYHAPFKEHVIEQIKKAKEDFEDNEGRFNVFDTYENDFSMTGMKERGYTRCWMMQTKPVIAADSNVYFCFDTAYTKAGLLGSIKDKSFKELWFSEEAKKKFKNYDPSIGCKHHCTNDYRNKIVDEAISCFGDDVNFI